MCYKSCYNKKKKKITNFHSVKLTTGVKKRLNSRTSAPRDWAAEMQRTGRTHLLQVPDHFFLAAVKNPTEELDNLLVVQVVNNFYDSW